MSGGAGGAGDGGPPPASAMAARAQAVERARAEIYPRLRAALEAEGGNVARAGASLWPDLTPRAARDRANRYVRRLGLVQFAAELRVAAQGRSMGRPQP